MMEIVVKIPKDVYTRLFDPGIQDNEIAVDDVCEMARALRLGKPLPEHHGDLVDRDAIEVLRIGIIKREYDKGFDAGVSCMVNRILETPTIIEADKENEE